MTQPTNAKFQWTEEAQKAFEKLKGKITTPPILKSYDPSKEVEFHTDASKKAIGVVIKQDGHPIQYGGRILTNAEKNYQITELEFLAVYYSLNRYKYYIPPTNKVTVITDHKALCFFLKFTSGLNSRLASWAIKLGTIDINIIHTPGISHTEADCLSRLDYQEINRFYRDKPQFKVEDFFRINISNIAKRKLVQKINKAPYKPIVEAKFIAQIDEQLKTKLTNIKELQKRDKFCKKIYLKLDRDDSFEDDNYTLENGLIHKITRQDKGKRTLRLVIPSEMRVEIIRYFHEQAHYGTAKISKMILTQMWWPKLLTTVKLFIRRCGICQNRREQERKLGRMTSIIIEEEIKEPFDFVAMDIIQLNVNSKPKYFLTIIDYLSRYLIATPVKDLTGRALVIAFDKAIAHLFGPPKSHPYGPRT